MIAFVFAAAVVAQAAAPAPPPATPPAPKFDLNSKLINTPDSNWTVYGPDQTNKKIDKGGPQNYPAIEVQVSKPGANAWDDGAVSPIPKPVGAGDVILVAMYLREPSLADGQTETLPNIGATGASAPYPAIASAPAKITNQWKLYYAMGKSPQAFPANGSQVTVHLGSAKHTIQLGPIKIFDLGPDFDMGRIHLPG